MRTSDKDGAHMRTAPRIKVFQAGEMRCGSGEPRRVHMLNISRGGALLYAESVPMVGEQVRLACGIRLGTARVQWSAGQRFGVAFTRPISPAQIAAVVGEPEEPVEVAKR
ncbi:PilZ domain-containing protein [Sphingomonas sp. DG1-23]|uniref:PilZ domain-containing protein n=1 Tax=Sphingomonas sp. DG1-23 TaxID=3068316 RepID=UPI00273F9576|nr:PilZ domain-containing protein [Sphingomonas sp. DG1-23]MDP5280168.1 PilZ domain-containing protein [Sphingomonas sp. DG1-23]